MVDFSSVFTVQNLNTALNIVETIAQGAAKVAPNATVGGIPLQKLVDTGTQAAEGSKDAIAYIAAMKALAARTTDPTAAELKALDDATSADVQHLLDSTKS